MVPREKPRVRDATVPSPMNLIIAMICVLPRDRGEPRADMNIVYDDKGVLGVGVLKWRRIKEGVARDPGVIKSSLKEPQYLHRHRKKKKKLRRGAVGFGHGRRLRTCGNASRCSSASGRRCPSQKTYHFVRENGETGSAHGHLPKSSFAALLGAQTVSRSWGLSAGENTRGRT